MTTMQEALWDPSKDDTTSGVWYRVEDLILSNNDLVSGYTDRYTQTPGQHDATSGNAPIFKTQVLGKRDGVHYDNVDDYVSFGEPAVQAASECTLFMVVKQVSAVVTSTLFGNFNTAANQRQLILQISGLNPSGQSFVFGFGGTTANVIARSTGAYDFSSAPRLMEADAAQSNPIRLFFNGTEVSAYTTQNLASGLLIQAVLAQDNAIGRLFPAGTGFANSYIGEFFFLRKKLSTGDRKAFRNYLGIKYNIRLY